jgi:hypothetical protein
MIALADCRLINPKDELQATDWPLFLLRDSMDPRRTLQDGNASEENP